VKVKLPFGLSPQERKAILSLALVATLMFAGLYEIGKRNLWFEPKRGLDTHVKDGSGLRVGGVVTLSGLKVGEVAALSVDVDNTILVHMRIKEDVYLRLRHDAYATVSRSFLIGEKRIDLSPGAPGDTPLGETARIPTHEAADLEEFLSGRKLAELMEQVEALIQGLNVVVKETDTLFGKYKDGTIDRLIARFEPSLERFIALEDDFLAITREIKKSRSDLPHFVGAGARLMEGMATDWFDNHLARDMTLVLKDAATPFADRRQAVADLLGVANELSRDLERDPRYGQKALEALKQLTLTLRALQRTWMLEDATEAVKAEDAKRQK
jgi:hypothetical protein